MSKASEFLKKHSLLPETVDARQCSIKMAEHMRSGLEGKIIDNRHAIGNRNNVPIDIFLIRKSVLI